MAKPILPFNWPKHGSPSISCDEQKFQEMLFRLIVAGRRWVAALGFEDAWIRGMVISFDFEKVKAPEDLAYCIGNYPDGRFAGFVPDNAKAHSGQPVASCLLGKRGHWVVPYNAIPDFNEPATIGGAMCVLRRFGAAQPMLATTLALIGGGTVDMAEAFADAAEHIAKVRAAKGEV